jgi:RNA polymerase sigma-70 factor, ECF subfamily
MDTDRSPDPTDHEAALRAVDQVALDFVADHGPRVERYLSTFTRDPDEAADLLQEIVLRLLLECRAGRAPDRPAAWAITVGRNIAISRARRRRTAEAALEWLPRPDASPSPEDALEAHERALAVHEAIAAVSGDGRTAVALAAQGYRGGEIAQRLGRTELATRTLLCRSRARMRTLIEASGPLASRAG